MTKTDYEYLGLRLAKARPELAQMLLNDRRPIVKDLDIMPKVKEAFDMSWQKPIEGTRDRTHYRTVFIAVAISVFDPDSIAEFKYCMRNGLRIKIAETLQCDPTLISHLFARAKDYLSIYKWFRDEVGEYHYKIITNSNIQPEQLDVKKTENESKN